MAEANLGLRGLKVGRTKHTLHQSYYLKQLLASQRKRDVGSCAFWAWELLASLGERDVGKGALVALGLLVACWKLSRTVTPLAYSDASHVLFRLTPTSSHALLLVTRTTPVAVTSGITYPDLSAVCAPPIQSLTIYIPT